MNPINTKPFQCVTCGAETIVKQSREYTDHTRRTRVCKNGHGFKTYQNGGAECFDCYLVPGVNRNGTEYRRMKRTYERLAIICEMYGNKRIAATLERARQKAGVMR